ncbi:MAG: hypothetical protein JNK76_22135 [Planctomycetales bacterium]|nr:hypothetical protein [Planctomycetales bacterium]
MKVEDARSIMHVKIVISAVATLGIVAHLIGKVTVDTAAVILFFLAALPWLSSILTSAELPGGWKLEFQTVKSTQEKQASEIKALKFLLANFLTEDEFNHLNKLIQGVRFSARLEDTTSFFIAELKRLRSLGFITGRPNCGVRTMERAMREAGAGDIDVAAHFEITERGREYVNLRNEMLTAGLPVTKNVNPHA